MDILNLFLAAVSLVLAIFASYGQLKGSFYNLSEWGKRKRAAFVNANLEQSAFFLEQPSAFVAYVAEAVGKIVGFISLLFVLWLIIRALAAFDRAWTNGVFMYAGSIGLGFRIGKLGAVLDGVTHVAKARRKEAAARAELG